MRQERNFNSAERWDKIWKSEGGTASWRIYPKAFAAVSTIINRDNNLHTVLDVGCGVGILANQLKQQGHAVTGLDISSEAIETMNKEYHIPGVIWDAKVQPFPFSNKRFDWCVATEFLEHFPPYETDGIISEISRISRRAVFTVPDDCLYPAQCPEHENVFTPRSLYDALIQHYTTVKLAGFNDIFETPQTPETPLIALRTILAECSHEAEVEE